MSGRETPELGTLAVFVVASSAGQSYRLYLAGIDEDVAHIPVEWAGRVDPYRLTAAYNATLGLPQATLAALPAGALAGLLQRVVEVGDRKRPMLPCRVDEMTPREVAIYEIAAQAIGDLHYLRDEARDALAPTPARDAVAGGGV